MSGLSPDARRLLDAARVADRTTRADRTRVRAALQTRLALSAAAAAAPASASLLVKAVAGAAFLVAATVAVPASRTPPDPPRRAQPAALARRVSPSPAPTTPSTAPVAPAPSIAPVVFASTPAPHRPAPPRVVARFLRPSAIASPTAAPMITAPAPAPVESTPSAPGEPDGLAAELSQLGDAQIALDQRRGDRALRLLDAYTAGHPQGALWEESAALRVLALCALGRPSEAREAAASLLREAPSSPVAARVRTSCVGATIPTRIDEPPVIP